MVWMVSDFSPVNVGTELGGFFILQMNWNMVWLPIASGFDCPIAILCYYSTLVPMSRFFIDRFFMFKP